jgi:hypothetical protein
MRRNIQDQFKYLVEYTIKGGVDSTSRGYVKTSGNQPNLNEEDPLPNEDPNMGAPAPAAVPETPAPSASAPAPVPMGGEPAADEMVPNVDGVEAPSPVSTPTPDPTAEDSGPEESEDDIVQKILKIHSVKLDTLEGFIDLVGDKMKEVDEKVAEIENIKLDVDNLRAKVKSLTPPTPLESGNMMIDISGGERIEDFWNQWLAKNGHDEQMGQNPYYPKEEKPQQEAPSFSETQVKDSLYKSINENFDSPEVKKL